MPLNFDDIVAVYESVRVPHNERKPDLYYYDLRHGDDNNWAEPVSVEIVVCVNFWGTMVTNKPVELTDEFIEGRKSLDLSEEEGEKLALMAQGFTYPPDESYYHCGPDCVHPHCCIGQFCKRDDKTGEYLPHDCSSAGGE